MVDCPIAESLLEDAIRATRDHVNAAENLSKCVGSPEHFAPAKLHAQQTYEECQAAFSALAKHRAEHKCVLASFAPASRSAKGDVSGSPIN